MARGPQKTTRLVRGGPLVTIILSNRTITTHNNGQYKTHYRYSRKSKTFVLNDCNVKIEVTEFGKEFQILGQLWTAGTCFSAFISFEAWKGHWSVLNKSPVKICWSAYWSSAVNIKMLNQLGKVLRRAQTMTTMMIVMMMIMKINIRRLFTL